MTISRLLGGGSVYALNTFIFSGRASSSTLRRSAFFYYSYKIRYSAGISVWPGCLYSRGVGCIFFEMASGRPLFAGSAVDEQLHLIVKLLGTPNELTWPGVSQLHEFLAYEFPRYRAEPLVKHVPRSVIHSAMHSLQDVYIFGKY